MTMKRMKTRNLKLKREEVCTLTETALHQVVGALGPTDPRLTCARTLFTCHCSTDC